MTMPENENLTNCLDCGGKVSRHANACLHCGAPRARFESEQAVETEPVESPSAPPPMAPSKSAQPESFNVPGLRAESKFNFVKIDMVRIIKHKTIFFPILTLWNVILGIFIVIFGLILVGAVYSSSDSLLITGGVALVWFTVTGGIGMAVESKLEDMVFEVEIKFEDGTAARQNESDAAKKMKWADYFFNVMDIYKHQRGMSENEMRLRAQEFLNLSNIKSRKVKFE